MGTRYYKRITTKDGEGALYLLGINSANGPLGQNYNLAHGDTAWVEWPNNNPTYQGYVMLYTFDVNADQEENDPYNIKPIDFDTDGPGQWILHSMKMKNLIVDTIDLVDDTVGVIMTPEERSKLGGVEENANNYSLENHDVAGASHDSSTLADLNSKISDATLIDTGDSRLSDSRTPTAHDLSGTLHNASTLADLNSKISDATLIDTADSRLSDSRTPTAHDLSGTLHNASTLADLNSKISDATLIDTGDSRLSDSRTPTAHDLSGTLHNASTLADLNTKISDATLIDTGDSRLSDSRTPTAHDLSGTLHNASTLADLNSKISDATLIDTGDSRLSDSRTPTAHASTHISGGSDTIANAVAGSSSGLMSAADKTKLDAIDTTGDPTSETVSATLTAAEIATKIITVNNGASGTTTLTLPTASDMDTGFSGFGTNSSILFSIINTSTTSGEDADVATNTGWTLVGNMDVGIDSSGRFMARKTGTAAWTLYRVA